MLDFINNYYEVTKENIDQLKHLMEVEDIRFYNGDKFKPEHILVGCVLGNNKSTDYNPNHIGRWPSKDWMTKSELKKVKTELPNQLMTIE